MLRALEPDEYPFFDYRRLTFSLGVTARGLTWLSGTTAAQIDAAAGKVRVTGDLQEQARLTFRKLEVALAAGGLTLADIVRVQRYVVPSVVDQLGALDELQANLLDGRSPAVGTAIVTRLLRSEALIEIEVIAASREGAWPLAYSSADGETAEAAYRGALGKAKAELSQDVRLLRTTTFTTPGLMDGPTGRQGQATGQQGEARVAVTVPRLVHRRAGAQCDMVAGAPDVELPVYVSAVGVPSAGGIVEQCRQAYSALGAQLAARGLGLSSIVKTTEFVTVEALGDYVRTAGIRRELFERPYPAATGLVCSSLPTGAAITIDAVAVPS